MAIYNLTGNSIAESNKRTGIIDLTGSQKNVLPYSEMNEAEEERQKNNGGFIGGVGYLGEKVGLGFLSGIEGIWDYTAGGLASLFGGYEGQKWAESQFANDWVNYNDADEWYNPSSGWKFAGDVAGGIGTSLPALGGVAVGAAVGYFSGGTLSPVAIDIISKSVAMGLVGLSAAGNATKEAYRQTGELGLKEYGYGALSGATEAGMELLEGAVSAGTGRIISELSKKAAKETTETMAKTTGKAIVKQLGKDFATEFAEEGLQEILEPYYARMTYDKDAKLATVPEVMYAALVGGLSGAISGGGYAVIGSAANLVSGAKAVNEGGANGIIAQSKWFAENEFQNAAENDIFATIKSTYDSLSESLAKTNGEVTTAKQKMQLGFLKKANVVATWEILAEKSAMNIIANADSVAERYTAFGLKDANGNPITLTRESILSGVDPNADRKTFRKQVRAALSTNSVLATLAVTDAVGQLQLSTQKIAESALQGQQIANAADLNTLIERGTPEQLSALSSELGIEDWGKVTIDEFRQKIADYAATSKMSDFLRQSERIRTAAEVSPENAKPVPKRLRSNMQDGTYRLAGENGGMNAAIIKEGDEYHIYDYDSGNISRSLSTTEVNKILNSYWTRGEVAASDVKTEVEGRTNLATETLEIDAFAKENIKEYSKMSEPNKQAVRMTIRQASANGITEAETLVFAQTAARTGLNIVFDNGKLDLGDGRTAEGLSDRDTGTIYVSTKDGKIRTYDQILVHELDHFLTELKGGKELIEKAIKNLPKADSALIEESYARQYAEMGESDASKIFGIIGEEISAKYAENLMEPGVLNYLLAEEPSFSKKILGLFSKAAQDYSFSPEMSKEARRFWRAYKKLFTELSERNQGNNALSLSMQAETKKAAQTDSVRIALPDDIMPYGDEEVKSILRDSKNSVAASYDDVERFFKESISGNDLKRLFVGKLKTSVSKMILEKTGINTYNKGIVLTSDDIRNIVNNHGSETGEALRGQTAITDENFSQIVETLFSPDDVSLSVDEKSGTKSILFEKSIDGDVTAVTLVSEKKKALSLKSAWINKKTEQHISPPSDVQAPNLTPDSELSMNAVPTNSISQNPGNVNTDSKKSSDDGKRFALRIGDATVSSKDGDYTFDGESEKLLSEIKQKNSVENFLPDGISTEFAKSIRRNGGFAYPRLYRGMEAAELDYIVENGFIKSNSSYNFSDQQGQTRFTPRVETAFAYATSFAPNEIRDKFFSQGLPAYIVEVGNYSDLNFANEDSIESYTYKEIDKKYITRIIELSYDKQTDKVSAKDITIPGMNAAAGEPLHGEPSFVKDSVTGTILFEHQGTDGYEDGKYISEKNPDILFDYDMVKEMEGGKFDYNAYLGISGKRENLIPYTQKEESTSLRDDSEIETDPKIAKKKTISETMSMDQCRDMINRAYRIADPNSWLDDGEEKYRSGDDWLKREGVDTVAMHIENEYTLQEKFLNKIPAVIDGDVYVEDILNAYLNGTLTGSIVKKEAKRLDIKQETGYKDGRIYAPKNDNIEDAKSLLSTAVQKVTKSNREEVLGARAKLLFLAHNSETIDGIGISRAELNKKLRSWSRYSQKAIDISNRINSGVPIENRWTGIQNCSILNKQTVSDSDILQMVKEIKGEGTEHKIAYIGRTMLALDTHIDWSRLSIEFRGRGFDNAKTTRGIYNTDKISIANSGYANTVAHEMGHALDSIWGRDIFDRRDSKSDVFLSDTSLRVDLIPSDEAKQFYYNFRSFIDKISDSSDIRSEYTQDVKEVFARFVAKFVEFTDFTAGNTFYQESTMYHDNFTASQYLEFARLLQEKAMLDAKFANEVAVKEKQSKSRDLRYALPENAEDIAKKYFGETSKWSEAGYILRDGTRLDFSGRHWEKYEDDINLGESYYSGKRNAEHYEILSAFGENPSMIDREKALNEFLARGNIRIDDKYNIAEIRSEPTEEQYKMLYKFFRQNNRHAPVVGFHDTDITFNAGTDASVIVDSVRDHFSRGKESEIAKFHNMRYALPDDPFLGDVLDELEAQGIETSQREQQYDPQAILDRGAPRNPGRDNISRGEMKKTIANNTRQKVYSLKATRAIVERFSGVSALSKKTRAEIADSLWQGLNDSRDIEERTKFSHEMAEFIVAKLFTEPQVENPDVEMHRERLPYLESGISRIQFYPEDRSELQHVLDKDGFRRMQGRWGFKGKKINSVNGAKASPILMETFVTDIAREMPGMEYLEDMNPADAFLEIDKMYSDAKDAVKNSKIPAYWDVPDSAVPGMVKSIEDMILQEFESGGEQSKYSKYVEGRIAEYQERAEFWKAEHDKLKGRNKLLGLLMSKAQRMKDLKLGTFLNASQFKNDLFKNSVEQLAKIQFRGNLNVTGTRKIMSDLRQWYVKENPILADSYDDGIAGMLDELATEKKGFSKEDLTTMYNVMSYFTNLVENFNKVYRKGKWIEAKPEAERYVATIRENNSLKVGLFARASGSTYMQTFGDPMTVARRMDYYQSGFYTEMMQELRDASVDAQIAEMELKSAYDNFMERNKKYLSGAEKETVSYRGATIPKIKAIALYMTLKRQQAQAGLALNGFTFYDADGKKQRVNGFFFDPNPTEEALRSACLNEQKTLEAIFSAEDKEYISILEKGYNEDARRLKADRDMQRLGFTNATNDYYYPIRRGNIAKNVDTSEAFAELDRVSSASFNKDTVKGAKQELYIESADTVFNRHVRAVCQYAYLSPAVEAYNRLFNLDISDNRNKPISVATESADVWSRGSKFIQKLLGRDGNNADRGNQYYKKLIADIQGVPASSSEGMALLGFVRGGYAKFQLSANPKVWVTQLSSLFAASSILDADSIVKGMAVSSDGLDTYCSLAKLRNNDNVVAKSQGLIESVGKASEFMMKPIGATDRFVVSRLFGACQVQVEKNGGAKVGTEVNKIEAGKLLRRVILETQQNAVATERSAAMRSGNEILRTVTMFTADSMKVVGRVIDSVGELSVLKARLKATTDTKAQAELNNQIKTARTKVRKSVTALMTSAVFMACVAQLFKWLYAKDRDEDESIAEEMIVDAVGNMMGGLPLIKDVYGRIAEGYDIDNYAYSSLNDLIDSTVSLFNTAGNMFSGDATRQDILSGIKSLSYSAGQVFGFPTRNIYNVLYGLTKRISPEAAYKWDSNIYKKNLQSDLKKAVESGDDGMVETILSIALNERIGGGFSEASVKELSRITENGYGVLPRAIASTVTIDGESVELTDEQKANMRQSYADVYSAVEKLISSKKYSSLADDKKADAINYVYDVYYEKALSEATGAATGKAVLVSKIVGVENMAFSTLKRKV